MFCILLFIYSQNALFCGVAFRQSFQIRPQLAVVDPRLRDTCRFVTQRLKLPSWRSTKTSSDPSSAFCSTSPIFLLRIPPHSRHHFVSHFSLRVARYRGNFLCKILRTVPLFVEVLVSFRVSSCESCLFLLFEVP